MQGKTTSTTDIHEDAVRVRAYHLWEADGRPDGRAEHYWQLAAAQAKTEPKKSKTASAKADVPEKKAKAA